MNEKRPLQLKELAVHVTKVREIENAISTHPCVMIIGPSGVGKTEIIRTICHSKFQLVFITNNASFFDFSKERETFNDYMEKLMKILHFTPRNTIVVIEDLPLLWTKPNELQFKNALSNSRNKVIVIYNSSLTDPYRMQKYSIPEMKLIYVKPTPKTMLKRALDNKLGYKTTNKELERYYKYAQGDIRQFLISFEFKLCTVNDTTLSVAEYCTNILYGILKDEDKHYEPFLMIPYINFNCFPAFEKLEDVANTLEWCSTNYAVMNQLESDLVNELYFDGLNSMHRNAKKRKNMHQIENPFRLKIIKHRPTTLLEEHARSCPEPVAFSDDDSIEDEL